jgi:transcriptional regulator with XRE-family HTH domain
VNIGERIREQRDRLELKQSDLARLTNVSSQVISNWERGYSSPDHSDVINLSLALGVTGEYLLKGVASNKNELETDMRQWLSFGEELKGLGYSLSEIELMLRDIVKTIKF